jgi:hypothetical protein
LDHSIYHPARLFGAFLIVVFLASSPVSAQEAPRSDARDETLEQGIDLSIDESIPDVSPPGPAVTKAPDTLASGAPRLALYATYGVMQALDVHSTLRALDDGSGVEANPLLRSVVSSPTGFIAFKVASTAGVVFLVERLRKKHPVAAFALGIGVTSLQAVVVMHNYRVGRR